jgi:nitrogen regulatory protein P-II 2
MAVSIIVRVQVCRAAEAADLLTLTVAHFLHLGSSGIHGQDQEYAHRDDHGSPDSRFDRCEMQLMKMITAVVRPFKLDELRQAIAQLGVQGVTVTEVYEAQFGPRAKVEIAVDDAIVEPVLEAIANVSRTGRSGDGRIFVGELEQAIRIRTGETGTAAT